jgi:hypothetical protein
MPDELPRQPRLPDSFASFDIDPRRPSGRQAATRAAGRSTQCATGLGRAVWMPASQASRPS